MGIKDIPETAEGFKQWITEYEDKAMFPMQTNHDVANHTTDEILHVVPEIFGLKNIARRLTICALDENVREAMMQPIQPTYLHKILHSLLHSFSFIQGHLCLPRSQSNPGGAIIIPLAKATTGISTRAKDGKPDPLHRMRPKWFQAKPWYMPEPESFLGKIKNRVNVALGLYDALPGSNLGSAGYRLEEMGPPRYEKSGHEEVLRMAEELYGCPITGPFSRR